MPDGPDRLHELVDHIARASNPEASLRAASALQAELEDVINGEAARALANGSSFGALARALGITRQAAHYRYRRLAGTEPPPEPKPRGRMLVTSEARTAVRHAREEAEKLGATVVGSEHLLLGVLHCRRAPISTILRDLGADLDAARGCVQPTVEDGLPDGNGSAPAVPDGPDGISDYSKRVFEQSLREAVARGDGFVGVEHLMLAALQDPGGGAGRTLDALGIDREVVLTSLAKTG